MSLRPSNINNVGYGNREHVNFELLDTLRRMPMEVASNSSKFFITKTMTYVNMQ